MKYGNTFMRLPKSFTEELVAVEDLLEKGELTAEEYKAKKRELTRYRDRYIVLSNKLRSSPTLTDLLRLQANLLGHKDSQRMERRVSLTEAMDRFMRDKTKKIMQELKEPIPPKAEPPEAEPAETESGT